MRLSVISEVANPKLTSMDGVEVNTAGNSVTYKFKDPNVPDLVYTVDFAALPFSMVDYRLNMDPVYTHLKMANRDRSSYTLALKSESIDTSAEYRPFSKTGRGNFGFVYGKLMACAIDFFVTRGIKVLFMQFSGYTDDMELVYNRILRRLNSEYPESALRPYEDDRLPSHFNLYVSVSAIDRIKDEDFRQQAFDKTSGVKLDDSLKKIRAAKRVKDPQDRGSVY